MKILILIFLASLLFGCSGSDTNTVKPSDSSDYLNYYYKLPIDSSYSNFRLIFGDTIPLGKAPIPRAYTKKEFTGDTIRFVLLSNKDTIMSDIRVAYTGYEADFKSLRLATPGTYHGYVFYVTNGTNVPIYDKFLIYK